MTFTRRNIFIVALCGYGLLTAGAGQSPQQPIDSPTPAGGSASTGIQIQNTSAAVVPATDLVLTSDLGTTVRLPTAPITATGAVNHYLPIEPLQVGRYAGSVASDVPLAAIVRSDWAGTGGAAIFSNPHASTEVVVPVVFRKLGGMGSHVAIQNVSGADATAELAFFRFDGDRRELQVSVTIPNGEPLFLDLDTDATHGLDSLGSFMGALFVTSTQPVAVATIVDVSQSDKGVGAYEGVPVADASDRLFLPLFRAMQFPRPGDATSGRMDTAAAVVNTSAQSVTARLRYFGADLDNSSCRNREILGPEVILPPRSGTFIRQSEPAAQGLPPDCFGAAVVEATGPVAATVFDSMNQGQTFAAYNGVPESGTANKVFLPLYRRGYGGLTTGVSIMNASDTSAQFTLEYHSQIGPQLGRHDCQGACTQTVEPHRTRIVDPGSLGGDPQAVLGSVVVISTQPVAVIVNDYDQTGVRDMATYVGLPESKRPCGPNCLLQLPWLLQRAGPAGP